jgi:hypothetical protein
MKYCEESVIVMGYRLSDLVSISGRGVEAFLLIFMWKMVLGLNQPPIQWVPGAFS